MKKLLLTLLLSTSLSTLSLNQEELFDLIAINLDFSSDMFFCKESPKAQQRNGLYYQPNQQKPFKGNNICFYEFPDKKFSEGYIWNGRMDGKWTWWYVNGQQWLEESFKDGELDGKQTKWYESGQKKTEGYFKDGKQNGKQTFWHENGQIQSKGKFKDGKLIGQTDYHYYNNGQINAEVNFKDHELDGKLTEWYENGQIKSEGYFKDGVCISGDC